MAPAIHIRDLSFAWPGQTAPCLTLSALDVDQGEQVFIQGESGAGKSTLLNLIGGVLLPREGRIQILDQALDALSAPARDRFRVDHIGFIFQQFNLLPYLSALDNVLLPCRFSATRARRAGARPVEAARRLLEALEVDAGDAARPASTLSVGQQQRVAAARALIGRPAVDPGRRADLGPGPAPPGRLHHPAGQGGGGPWQQPRPGQPRPAPGIPF
jgi:putative ABC transport system ATP-binding protein